MGTYKMTMSEQSVLADWTRYEKVCRAENRKCRDRLHGQTIEAMNQASANGRIGGNMKRKGVSARCKKTKQKTS